MSGDFVDIGIFVNWVFMDKMWFEFMVLFKFVGFIVFGNKECLFIKGLMNFCRNLFKDFFVKVYMFYNCNGVV